jgi:hypothetical protein
VIAAERDNSESAPYVPSQAILDQLLSALRSTPDFVQIAAIPTLNGRCFFVFQNVHRVPLRDSRRPESWSGANAEWVAPRQKSPSNALAP